MNATRPNSYPSDICLLLRAHGEQVWLARHVVPVMRQLEQPDSIPDDQLGAALAYLEVLWLDACRRAEETEAAYALLLTSDAGGDRLLHAEARQYHAAVRAMRETVSRHVSALTAAPATAPEPEPEHEREPSMRAPEPIAYAGADAAPLRSAVALHALRRRPAGR
jgi:hypothetical protein